VDVSRRVALLRLHDRLLDAVRSGDVEGCVSVFSASADVAVRDPRGDAQTVFAGDGSDAVRARYQAIIDMFAEYEVLLLNRVAGEWYVFADWAVRGTLRPGVRPDGPSGGAEIRFASLYGAETESCLDSERGYCIVRDVAAS
jgi:hypothetical protein